MTEPYYDEDIVNLGYLKKQIDTTNKDIEEATKNVSKHYGSQPVPPYNEGDTWNDGEIIYTCINSRLAGNYVANDWRTESGALDIAKSKSKTYLAQPTNYKQGDTWILQSDLDHPLGKKGELLIASKNGTQYIASDWVKEITYVTQEEKATIDTTLQNVENSIEAEEQKINAVENIITAQEETIRVISTNIDEDGNITGVKTTNGFTFNSNGMKVYVEGETISTIVNHQGVYTKDNDEVVMQADKDGLMGKDFKQRGQHKYAHDDTDYLFVDELIEVDGEQGYATFYNGND